MHFQAQSHRKELLRRVMNTSKINSCDFFLFLLQTKSTGTDLIGLDLKFAPKVIFSHKKSRAQSKSLYSSLAHYKG